MLLGRKAVRNDRIKTMSRTTLGSWCISKESSSLFSMGEHDT